MLTFHSTATLWGMSMHNIAILDGDLYVFKACSAVEEEVDWGDGLVTLYSYKDKALHAFDTQLTFIKNAFAEETLGESFDDIWVCFSGKGPRFRNNVFPDYKANRKECRKPLCYYDVVEHIKSTYNVFQEETLEGDDLLGLLATEPTDDRRVMVSGDKDLLTIPAWFLNTTGGCLHVPDQTRAEYNFMYQTLIGDQTDGYPGCPGIGPKKAEAFLKDSKYGETLWERVVKGYERYNLSENDAIIQARVARILRYGEYNWSTKQVALWNPPIPEVS